METFYDTMNTDGGFQASLAALGPSLLMYLLIEIVICEIFSNKSTVKLMMVSRAEYRIDTKEA